MGMMNDVDFPVKWENVARSKRGGKFPTAVGKVSRTHQEFADECDINNIMRRYEKTGVLPVNVSNQPVYLDVSNVPDLQESMQRVSEAHTAFMRLPARVRAEFNNDPVLFVDYAGKPENLEQMRAWGLAEPLPEPAEPMAVRVVPAEGDERPEAAPKPRKGRSMDD